MNPQVELSETPVRCVEFVTNIYKSVKVAMMQLLKNRLPIGFISLPLPYALLCGSKICWAKSEVPEPDEGYGLRFAGVPVRAYGVSATGLLNGTTGAVCVPFEFLSDLKGDFGRGQEHFVLPEFTEREFGALDELMSSPVWQKVNHRLVAEHQMLPWAIEHMKSLKLIPTLTAGSAE